MYKVIKDGSCYKLWKLDDEDKPLEVLATFNTKQEADFWEKLIYKEGFLRGVKHVLDKPEYYGIKK